MSTTFDQTVFTLPKPQGKITLRLGNHWAKLKANERVITNRESRIALRTIGVRGNPDRPITFDSQDETQKAGYDLIMGFADNSKAHVDKFDRMAARAKQDKANRKFIAELRAELGIDS